MKIAVASDLHLEFGDIDLKNTEDAEVLILSGDILIAEDLRKTAKLAAMTPEEFDTAIYQASARTDSAKRFRGFLDRVSNEFPNVVYVAGNHEFYHGKWEETIDVLRNECARYTNIYYLERDTTVINDITFVGGTLWTDCNKGDPLTLHGLANCMYDFTGIRNDKHGYTKLRPAHTMDRHRQTVDYFKNVLDNSTGKVVIVGHHAPSSRSVHERYIRDTIMNGGYYSDLSEFILDNPKIVLWTHGHMHDRSDYMIGDTRIVCNPRGYEGHDIHSSSFKLQFVEV
tara:strand:- start:213 stop:1064 length:852 start_codon:yes stop_codon:yes gene_type:complete